MRRWPSLATSVRVEPAVADPALLVIFGHAAIDERRHPVEIAVAPRPGQRLDADVLVVAGIVALVELVAAAELAADRVPQQLHDLDALLVIDAVGAAHITLE